MAVGPRYCIENFIPTAWSCLLVVFCFGGDNRGPYPYVYPIDQGFRIRQFIYSDGSYYSQYGFTTCCLGAVQQGGPPILSSGTPCSGGAYGPPDVRMIYASCSGSVGFSGGFAPPIVTQFRILEQNGVASVVSAFGTPYPSTEVWQYGAPDGTVPVFYHEATPLGPGSLFFPGPLSPSELPDWEQ